MEWDAGPPANIRTIFEQAPVADYEAEPHLFRLEWEPVYYRGPVDGSAKVLVIGQDPAASENIIRRAMVGEAGQRVQRYLAKLGLTRSYVIVNSVLYSIFGQFDQNMKAFMDRPAVTEWRNALLDALATPDIQAVVGFGKAAEYAISTWPGAQVFKAAHRLFLLLHPTARPESAVFADWSSHLAAIGSKITADPDGTQDLTLIPGRCSVQMTSSPFRPAISVSEGLSGSVRENCDSHRSGQRGRIHPPDAATHSSILVISPGMNQ